MQRSQICQEPLGTKALPYPYTLPEKLPPVRNWVGRSRELETLKTLILDPAPSAIAPHAICIVGSPGIGKTTLASQLVRQLQTENTPFLAAAWSDLRSPTNKPPDSSVRSIFSCAH